MNHTEYIDIPKEKAARILTREFDALQAVDHESDPIVLKWEVKKMLGGTKWRTKIKLYNYKIPDARVETDSSEVESGVVGTRMEYNRGNLIAYNNFIEDFISKYRLD